MFSFSSGGKWSNIDTHLVRGEAVWSLGTVSGYRQRRDARTHAREAMFSERLTSSIFSLISPTPVYEIANNELQLNSRRGKSNQPSVWKSDQMTVFCITALEKFQASAEYESDYSADGRCGCCCCYRISSLVIHMLHKYIIKTLVTCNNLLDWLNKCKFLWCASSQTDQSGLWALADRHPWLLSTITTLIILHASYCRALPFERSNQTADERLNNHTALNVLGIACVCVCLFLFVWELLNTVQQEHHLQLSSHSLSDAISVSNTGTFLATSSCLLDKVKVNSNNFTH